MLELNPNLLDNRVNPGKFSADPKAANARPYIADPALETAAALSILLCQPLLLSGLPGVGKTGAAYYIAGRVLADKRDPIRYTVTTQTSGRDLLYSFDALGRFRDKDNSPLRNFLRFEALGRAIVEACGAEAKVYDSATGAPVSDVNRIARITGDKPEPGHELTVQDLLRGGEAPIGEPRASVVLIDEIDKAPRDTPNDLLESFDSMRFTIDDLGLKIGVEFGAQDRRRAYPIVVCTTNAENNLPDAFLRRCVFHEIAMPEDDTLLRRIIEANLRDVAALDEKNAADVAEAALASGRRISERIKTLSRPPGTAEFIALARAILATGLAPARVSGKGAPLTRTEASALLGVVVKTAEDLSNALPIFVKAR